MSFSKREFVLPVLPRVMRLAVRLPGHFERADTARAIPYKQSFIPDLRDDYAPPGAVAPKSVDEDRAMLKAARKPEQKIA